MGEESHAREPHMASGHNLQKITSEIAGIAFGQKKKENAI
jgi:hypothetical protein